MFSGIVRTHSLAVAAGAGRLVVVQALHKAALEVALPTTMSVPPVSSWIRTPWQYRVLCHALSVSEQSQIRNTQGVPLLARLARCGFETVRRRREHDIELDDTTGF